MQSIGSVDSWAQFVNLVQDARMRNQSLSGVKSAQTTGQVFSARRTMNSAAVAAPQQTAPASPVARMASPDAPKAVIQTLGSYFDAYA